MMELLCFPVEAKVGSIRCQELPSKWMAPSTQPVSWDQTLIQAW